MSDPTAPSSLPPEPSSGPATPPPVSQAAPQGGTQGTGLAPNVAAGLACVFSLIGGIVFLVLEKKNQFVRFWAMQATIFGGVWLLFQIVLTILVRFPYIGWIFGLLGLLVGLAFLAVWVVMIVKSFTSKEWEMPYIGKIAREQLAKMAASETNPPAPSAPTAS